LPANPLALLPRTKPASRNKYHSIKWYVTPGGLHVGASHEGPKAKVADSTKEFLRLLDLQRMQAAGLIFNLRTQVSYKIIINGVKVCSYVADAVYVLDGTEVVEDTKSEITRKLPVYRLKKKLLLACLGINITEN
jgi:ABC-type antimicrobial peptide transport system ATPase subunit